MKTTAESDRLAALGGVLFDFFLEHPPSVILSDERSEESNFCGVYISQQTAKWNGAKPTSLCKAQTRMGSPNG